MKPILLFPFVLTLTNALASPATDSIPDNSYPALFRSAYQPIFRLTEKDITHLPFTNIIEVINGRFPFVFADPPSTSQYTFLVDGHMVLNVNSINISQIALIEYYPVSFDPGGGYLSLKGTFVITTKLQKPGNSGFSIRSQGGVMLPTQKVYDVPGQFSRELHNSFFTHQEIGYDHVGKRLQLSAGGSFTSNPDPSYDLTNATETFRQTNNISHRRFRFSMFGGYDVSKKVRISLALLGTSIHEKREGYSENTPLGRLSDFTIKDDVPYFGGAIGIDLNLSPHFSNTLQVEYSRLKTEYNSDQIAYAKPPTIPGLDQQSNYYLETKDSRMAVINTSRGVFTKNNPVEFGWQLILRYYKWDEDYYNFLRVWQPPGTPFLSNEASSSSGAHVFAVMPGLSMNVNKQFTAQLGVTYESNSALQDDERKILPYAGVNWTAPLKGTKLSTLQIHSSFAKAPAANFKSDLLDTYGRPGNEPGASPIFGMGALKYGYNWITGVNAGFGNNRIMTSVNFLVGHVYPGVIFPVPGGPALVTNHKIKRNGISLDIQATIANNENFSCKLRTMVFYERFKYSGPGTVNEDLYFANPMLNDDLSPQVRGSVSVDMTAGKFFMQVQGLVRFRDEGYNNVDAFTRERIPISNHGLTFLVVGYSFGSEKSKGLQCDVSVQTRNLAMMKEPRAGLYYGSRYVGLGINVRI